LSSNLNPNHKKLRYALIRIKKYLLLLFLDTFCYRYWRFANMKAQDRARRLLARRRQQYDNRRASMLGRSGQEVSRQEKSSLELQ
jgi:hypothetical protein